MFSTHNRRFIRTLAGGAIVAAAGTASAIDFTFSPNCSNLWGGTCSTSCPGGGFGTLNNWGYNSCVAPIQFPGPADNVLLGGNAVTINTSVDIMSMSHTAASIVTWDSGTLNIANGFTNVGQFRITGGNKTLSTSIVNNGLMTDSDGWTRTFSNAILTSNGTLGWTYVNWTRAGGDTTSRAVNNGTLDKTTASPANISIPFEQNGDFNAAGGLSTFGVSVTSAPGATWNLTGGSVRFQGCVLSGTFSGSSDATMDINGGAVIPSNTTFAIMNAGMIWEGGTLSIDPAATLTIAPNSLFRIRGGNKTLAGRIVNNGTLTDEAGWTRTFSDAVIESNGSVAWSYVNWTTADANSGFINRGALTKDTTSPANITMPVENSGPWTLNGGLVNLQVALDSQPGSAYTIATGSELRFTGTTLGGTLVGVNDGSCRIFGGATLSDDLLISLAGNGVAWESGTLTAPSDEVITVDSDSVFRIEGGNKTLAADIVNHGTMSDFTGWTRTFDNATITTDGQIDWTYVNWTGTGTLNNTGNITKTSPSPANLNIALNHNGTLDHQNGLISIDQSLVSGPAATYTVANGATFRMATCSASGRLAGTNDGVVEFRGSTTTIPDDLLYTMTGNPLVWEGGTLDIDPSAEITIAAGSSMLFSGGNKTLNGRIVNNGTLHDNNGWTRSMHDGGVVNNGTIEFAYVTWRQPDAARPAPLMNNGALRKSSPSPANLTNPVTNNGLINIEQGELQLNGGFSQGAGGEVHLNGGNIRVNQPMVFADGELNGAGSIFGDVENAGAEFNPGDSPGRITISGDYTQGAGGVLNIELGGSEAGTGYDQIAVGDDVFLAGTLNLTFIDGYDPAPGQLYTIISCDVRNGQFTTFNQPIPLGPGRVQILYETNAVKILALCPADWDASGGVDGDDIGAFFADWQQGNGDFDRSGGTDGDDIVGFFNAWQTGC